MKSIDWRAGGAHCCGTAAQTLSECFISPTDGTCAHMCAARCRRCRSGSGAPGSTDKVKNVQKQVDDVVAVMQSNLEKTLERGERLDQLQTKTGRWGVKGANWVAWANGQKTWSHGQAGKRRGRMGKRAKRRGRMGKRAKDVVAWGTLLPSSPDRCCGFSRSQFLCLRVSPSFSRGVLHTLVSGLADELQTNAAQFKKGSTKLRKAMWWKNMKLNLMIAGVCLVIIAIIVIIIVTTTKPAGG